MLKLLLRWRYYKLKIDLKNTSRIHTNTEKIESDILVDAKHIRKDDGFVDQLTSHVQSLPSRQNCILFEASHNFLATFCIRTLSFE
jgi:hypothetical protein